MIRKSLTQGGQSRRKFIGGQSRRKCIIIGFLLVTLVVISLAVAAAVTVAIHGSRDGSRDSNSQPSVAYQLHVNPADSVILTAETPDGDLISVIGERSAGGAPLTVDEFIVENDEHGSVFVSMNNDGSIRSALSSDGLKIDFIWYENQTVINTTTVINGSKQVFVKVNLSEPVDKKFVSDANHRSPTRRSYTSQSKYTKAASKLSHRKRATQTTDHAEVFVSVKSCNGPRPSTAKVYADVLLGYNQHNGTYKRKVKCWGMKSSRRPREYKVKVPTAVLRNGTNFERTCDSTNIILADICNVFHKLNGLTKSVSMMDVDSVFCLFLKNGVLTEFPSRNLSKISHFCKSIFRPFKSICNQVSSDSDNLGVILPCSSEDSLSLVDNGVATLKEENIFFTPTAIFPQGNIVQGAGQMLTIQPGASVVPHHFSISDGGPFRITGFSIIPFDPLPGENYVVNVSYNCYMTPMFSAHISVVGTDSFADSKTCYAGPTCALTVAGSDKSAKDSVNVTIQNGQSKVSVMSEVHF